MSLNLDFHKGIQHSIRLDWAADEGPREQGPGINWKELPTALTRSVNWITVSSSEPQTDISENQSRASIAGRSGPKVNANALGMISSNFAGSPKQAER